MKFYCASISHETSRFSPIPTNLDSYREAYLYLPSKGEGSRWKSEVLDEVSWSRILRARGHEAVFGPLASAQPSRPTAKADYQTLKCELINALASAMPVDGVLLFLHGAQVAEGTDDCAGDMLQALRRVAGGHIPIGVEIDLHGNVSATMIDNADVLLSCLEYPHIDFGSRAEYVADLIIRAAAREIRPVMVHRPVPMLGTYYTTQSPMREFIDWAKGFEGRGRILAVSVTHGFAWADVPFCGAGVIVCADGKEEAEVLADEIAERYWSLRDRIRAPRVSVEQAVEGALGHEGRPVIIADTTDNPGGGAAGDSTFLLRALQKACVTESAVGMLWDPIAVKLACRAGVGARLPLRIGGKTGPGSGPPLDVEATVLAYRSDATQWAQGMNAPLGLAVAIAVGGIRIVLNSIRQQVFDPVCFEAFGIDPRSCRIVVVKSHQHFYEKFGPLASKVIYATPPGTVNMDYRTVPFRNITRPVYPIDEPPFTRFGRTWRT